VDLADIGLMNETEARGRRRLNESIAQLYDVIKQGLTGTVHNFRFDVTSLRRCTSARSINDGCTNGTVVAVGPSYAGDTTPSTKKEPVITTVSFATKTPVATCPPTTAVYQLRNGFLAFLAVIVFCILVCCFIISIDIYKKK